MKLERPSTILRILNDLKWSDKFVCLKCGNTKYIKGDDLYDRKCGKCKKNVSLFKHTAFEGLRFPIEKAYGILEFLIERTVLDIDAKVIKMYNRKKSGRQGYDLVDDPEEWRDPKNICDEYEYLSLSDLLDRSKPKEIKRQLKQQKLEEIEFAANNDKDFDEIIKSRSKEARIIEPKNIDKQIEEINNRWRPTIGMLAKRFDLEENTVVKFLEKINLRLRNIYREEPDHPLERILSQLEYDYHSDSEMSVQYFLGMAMVPLVGEWKYGLGKFNGVAYGIARVEDKNRWSIFRMTGKHDGFTYTFETHEQIEYGTDEWIKLFTVNIDR